MSDEQGQGGVADLEEISRVVFRQRRGAGVVLEPDRQAQPIRQKGDQIQVAPALQPLHGPPMVRPPDDRRSRNSDAQPQEAGAQHVVIDGQPAQASLDRLREDGRVIALHRFDVARHHFAREIDQRNLQPTWVHRRASGIARAVRHRQRHGGSPPRRPLILVLLLDHAKGDQFAAEPGQGAVVNAQLARQLGARRGSAGPKTPDNSLLILGKMNDGRRPHGLHQSV